jgi:hypothetical protein
LGQEPYFLTREQAAADFLEINGIDTSPSPERLWCESGSEPDSMGLAL